MQIEELIARLHGVRQSGKDWTAKCPGHDDGKNSLIVSVKPDGKIGVHCFAGCNADEILVSLGWTAKDLYPPKQGRKPKAKEDKVYDYFDADGTLIFQVVRFIPKDFRQRRPIPGGGYAWSFAAGEYVKGSTGDFYRAKSSVDKGERIKLPALKNRPLYNLPAVLGKIEDEKAIFLVEGEKDADSINALGPFTATTNAGGSSKWDKTYTKILRDALVFIIPDADDPGRQKAERLRKVLPNSVILELPGLLPGQKDITDWLSNEGNDADALAELTQQAFKARRPVSNTPNKPSANDLDSQAQAYSNGPSNENGTAPFIPLGHNNGRYFFLPTGGGQIIDLAPGSLSSKPTFFTLATLPYWENTYGESGSGPNYVVAADSLISQCHTRGLFNPSSVRGRGAWWDAGRTVLHQGDRLTVDGVSTELLDLETEYIYPKAFKLNIPHNKPADVEDCERLADLLEMLNWERPLSAKLLAGWITIAPICGVLDWRPHIWITGASGSGKSWVTDEIVGPILGDMALKCQSVTTEAGIRQTLGQDALPVTFDEAEGDDLKTQANIQRVLELARQASSNEGGKILKGSAGGSAIAYDIRSMFYMSSIGVGVKRRADETRVTVLSMLKPPDGHDGADRFKEIEVAAVDLLISGEFSPGLIARSCRLAPVIRANARTLAVAISRTVSSKRTGDQLGALLAGHRALISDSEMSEPEALEYVGGLNLAANGFLPESAGDDAEGCLRFLMEQRVMVEMQTGTAQRTIGELVDTLAEVEGVNSGIGMDTARGTLKRYGFHVADGIGLQISTNHSAIARMLTGTPWSTGWSRYLNRIEGAEHGRAVRFGAEGQSKVTTIPWATFEGEPIQGV